MNCAIQIKDEAKNKHSYILLTQRYLLKKSQKKLKQKSSNPNLLQFLNPYLIQKSLLFINSMASQNLYKI